MNNRFVGKGVRMLAVVLTLLLCMVLFPTAVLAADVNGDGYDDNDFARLQTFLNQNSNVAGKTNGQQINASYDPANPSTWTGVTWSAGSPKQAVSISWYNKSLAGPLDVSDMTSLNYLLFTANKVTSLDVSGASALATIFCFDNQLASITLSGNSSLQNIYASNNRLTSLDLSGAPGLIGIQCNSNQLDTLNVSSNPLLETVYCAVNQLESLDVSHNAALKVLSCMQNPLESLDVSHNTALADLAVYYCELSELDLSDNVLLAYLDCSDNDLTALNLQANTVLSALLCSGNALTSLDLSRNTVLIQLSCGNNQLTTLDLGGLGLLNSLDCSGNRLTTLSINAGASLGSVNCQNNLLTSIQARTDYYGNIDLSVRGNGYVEAVDDMFSIKVNAVPQSGALFLNWTNGTGTVVSSSAGYSTSSLSEPLTANFLSLSASGESTVLTGDSITLTPSFEGGAWSFDATLLSREGNTFTGLAEGICTVFYTYGGKTVSYDVTVVQRLTLSSSVSGGTIYTGGRITLTPNIDGGEWDWDEEYLSATFNSPATFTGLKAGTTTVTYTVGGQSMTCDVTIEESALPGTGQDYSWAWAPAGLALAIGAAGVLLRRRRARTSEQ